MTLIFRLLDHSVGQKVVAAATGIGLIAFVIVHMLGNLQMFIGQDAINSYAVQLKSLGGLLWIARIGLLLLVTLHIAMTVRLAWINRSARNTRYAKVKHQTSTRSSRYMIISGSVILLFVLFHLAHFTLGWIQPESYELTDAEGRHDVYSMVVDGFKNWAISGFYIVGMLFLCSHLSHAMYSPLQTLGLTADGADTIWKRVAWVGAVTTAVGFLSIPVAVLLGWLH